MDRRLDRTSDVYAGTYSTPTFQQHHRMRIHWMCRQARGQRALDVGCSQGISSILLGREGMEMVGVDIEPELIQQAQEALAREPESVRSKVTFIVGDILTSGEELGEFDTIITGEILEHLVHPERVVQRCHELLKDDGVLVITVPFGLHPFPDHKRTYYLSTLAETLSPHFAIESLQLLYTAAGADSPAPLIGAVARKQPTPAPAEKQDLREWFEFSERGFIAAEERYTAQIIRLQEREEQLRRRSEDQADRLRAVDAELTEVRGNAQDLERRLRGNVQDLERRLAESASRYRALSGVEEALRAACRDRDRAVRQLARRLAMMEDATSYRLGLLIVRALRRPYLLLALPFQVIGLLTSAAVRKLRGKERRREQRMVELRTPLAPIPPPGTAAGAGSPVAGSTTVGTVAAPPSATEAAEGERTRLLLSGSYESPGAVKDLVVAAILDEFTLECLRPECRIVTFRPDNWQGILERERPHFLLVESAWKGNGGSWEYRVAQYNYPGREELERLVHWCRQNGIPTIFWNKEDPVHFKRFIDTAKLFDHIFTTDANCIPEYRKELAHDRVYALPFAAQPRLHNPIRVSGYREKGVCFAGSYYRNRHPQRREELEWLLDAAFNFGLEIYDRGHGQTGRGTDQFTFPERFQAAIAGGLPYNEIVRAYKQYKVFLNVNSVTDSPTMFSRRVFELLACGTPVVSTPARGITELLGPDVVQIVRSRNEAQQTLARLLSDDLLRERLGLAGQRLVATRHTYAHRLHQLATQLGYNIKPPTPAPISAVAWALDESQLGAVTRTLAAQQAVDPEILLICPPELANAADQALSGSSLDQRGRVLASPTAADPASWWKEALADASGDGIAFFDPQGHYGPHYLGDLARALAYSGADIVGKAAYYQAEPGAGLALVGEERDYVFTDSVRPTAMLARRDLLADLGRLAGSLRDPGALAPVAAAGARIFSADRFNYVHQGVAADCAPVDI